jgi:micrococcal nuclease
MMGPLGCSKSDRPGQTAASDDVDRNNQATLQDASVGIVTRVLDGATIEVEIDGATILVRYLGVAVPDGEDREGAVEFNRFLVDGKSVRMSKDAVEADSDGVPLRYVYSDGEMVNLKLLTSGWARLAEYPPNFELLDDFAQAENSAKSDRRGLWKSAAHDFEGHEPTATPAAASEFTGGTLPMAPASPGSGLCDYSGTSEPVIKGNIDQRTAEREYHVPGGLFYSTTAIEPADGEMWFCTETEALSQGWQRAKH